MNLALFFEGTGQGVRGRKTNVSLVYEACVREGQALHLEPGPGTHVGYFFSGAAAGRDWRKIFASACTWFDKELESLHSSTSTSDFEAPHSSSPNVDSFKIFLFGFSRGALLARHFAAWLNARKIEVEYMGLWDTVDAIPDLEVSETCPPNVKFARHAVAENEARRFYDYVPLREVEEERSEVEVDRETTVQPMFTGVKRGLSPFGRVEERLFPGVHSDVGGLYEDNHELADAARAWVVQPAQARGLRLTADAFAVSTVCRSPTAVRHDSLRHFSNLFGLLRPVQRIFPTTLRRVSDIGVRAVVSLGSNIEPRQRYLKRAVAALAALPQTRLVRASSVIETEPVDVPKEFAGQKFLNQVAVFETELAAADFARRMHAIEDDLGRVRTVRNGPRTIDLDLIDFGGLVLKTPELTLPHPRAHLRDFVLRPMRELGATAAQL